MKRRNLIKHPKYLFYIEDIIAIEKQDTGSIYFALKQRAHIEIKNKSTIVEILMKFENQ